MVQLRTGGEAFAAPPTLNLSNSGGGRPLPAPVREKMESFFGTSFADVRVHVGPQASSIGALAFTHGSNLYFAPGQYNPNTAHGRQLLGHELTHVVQQRAGRVRNPFGSGVAVVQDAALEAEADRMGMGATAIPILRKSSPAGQSRKDDRRVASFGSTSPASVQLMRRRKTGTSEPTESEKSGKQEVKNDGYVLGDQTRNNFIEHYGKILTKSDDKEFHMLNDTGMNGDTVWAVDNEKQITDEYNALDEIRSNGCPTVLAGNIRDVQWTTVSGKFKQTRAYPMKWIKGGISSKSSKDKFIQHIKSSKNDKTSNCIDKFIGIAD